MASGHFLILFSLCYVIYFNLEVKAVSDCGGLIEATNGTITSPLYPLKYPANQSCIWEVKVPPNNRIHLHFKYFHLEINLFSRWDRNPECNDDFVTIKSKREDGSEREHGKFCGEQAVPDIISDSNILLIDFKSDNLGEFGGFEVEFFSECGWLIEESHGIISNPLYPPHYPDTPTCIWEIRVPPKNRIYLHFTDFDMMGDTLCTGNDSVIIRSKRHNGAIREHGKFCGKQVIPNILSDSNTVLIEFKSDSGGLLSFFTLEFFSKCGELIEETNGTISSPLHPSLYPNVQRCNWEIKMPTNYRIGLHFKHFNLERQEDCSYDSVIIKSKKKNGAIQEHGKYCGSHLIPNITSDSNILLIEFNSDANNNFDGFKVEFFSVCGERIEETHGTITSPLYPSNYPYHEECTWEIKVPPNHNIGLYFRHFHLEGGYLCDYDSVTVKSKMEDESVREHGKFCGKQVIPNITSESNILLIEFRSDGSNNYDGFKVDFFSTKWTDFKKSSFLATSTSSTYVPHNSTNLNHNNTEIKNMTSINETNSFSNEFLSTISSATTSTTFAYERNDSITEHHQEEAENGIVLKNETNISQDCGGLIEKTRGAITSPLYPAKYPANQNCTWEIKMPPNHIISLHFRHFVLERQEFCSYDYVIVESKMEDGSVQRHGKFCGEQTIPNITSYSNNMLIEFRSDGSHNDDGFMMEFFSERCGGLIEGGRGNISSPYFPASYSPNEICEWVFMVPAQHKIKMHFLQFQVEEGGDDCLNDFLLIQSKSEDGNVYHYGKHCGDLRPSDIFSKDSLLLTFVSDRSFQRAGFKVEYAIDKFTDYELSISLMMSTTPVYVPHEPGQEVGAMMKILK